MAVVIGGGGGQVSEHFTEWLVEFVAKADKGDVGVIFGVYSANRVLTAALEQAAPPPYGVSIGIHDPFVSALLAEL